MVSDSYPSVKLFINTSGTVEEYKILAKSFLSYIYGKDEIF
jgi:hypothetical protein